MRYDIHICPTCTLGVVRIAGRVHVRGLSDFLNALWDYDQWTRAIPMLWDLRSVSDMYVKPAAQQRLAALAETLRVHDGTGRAALLTSTASQQAYGVELLRATYGDRLIQRSFHSHRRALRWLQSTRERRNGLPSSCSSECPVQKNDVYAGRSTSPPVPSSGS